MISKLSIKNFQSHANTSLQFTPGINVIVGSSDAGKSAILRAIKWVMFNRPLGDNIIRQGEITCVVDLEANNGHIKRSKGKDNYYAVDEEVYRACGSNVPDAVSSVLNISEINCLGQFDGYYLVFQSSGEIAKELNKALNIDLIDACIYECNSSIRDYNSLIRSQTKQREDFLFEFGKYENLDKLEKEINSYISKSEIHSNYITIYTKLSALLYELNKVNTLLNKAVCDYGETQSDIKGIADLLKDCDTKHTRYSELLLLYNEINRVKKFIVGAETNVDATIANIKTKRLEYESLLKNMNVCPFCNRKMTQAVCDHITRRLK